MLNILGIDPGLAHMGWAIVDLSKGPRFVVADVVRTQKTEKKAKVLVADDNFVRAQIIRTAIAGVIEKYQVKAVCAEAMSHPRQASAAAQLAMSWGVLAALAGHYDLPFVCCSPQELKKRLVGRKDASKLDVQASVEARFPTAAATFAKIPKTRREHPVDALGAIVASLDSDVIRLLRKLGV